MKKLGWVIAGACFAHALLLAAAAITPASALIPGWLAGYLSSTSWPAMTVQMCLALAAWGAYYVPRRRQSRAFSLVAVAAVGSVSLALGIISYWQCSADEAPGFSAISRALSLFLGNMDDPFGQVSGCAATVPLALQIARLGALVAIGVGVGIALALLFRGQIDRVLVRMARELTVVLGVDGDSDSLLARIASEGRPRGRVVVLLEDIDATPPRRLPTGVIALRMPLAAKQLASVRLAGGRSRLRSLYLLSPDPSVNISRLNAFNDLTPASDIPLVAVLRIDDTWQAEYWRRKFISADQRWLVDIISPYEQTARMLVDRIVEDAHDRVIVWGDSMLRLGIGAEFAQRRREARVLRGASTPPPPVIFLGPGSEEAHRQHVLRQVRFGNSDDELRSDSRAVNDALLDELLAGSANPVIVRATRVENRETAAVSALAAAHPDWTIFSWEIGATELSVSPIMERLFTFGLILALRDEAPLHAWERIARIVHANYLQDYGLGAGPASLPWDDGLSSFYQESNLRLVMTTLASAVAVGRGWGPFTGPSADEPTQVPTAQLAEMARLEHESWRAHNLRHGWKVGPVRDDKRRIHDRLLPWDQLDAASREKTARGVTDSLNLLAALGYRSTEPAPTATSTFRRRGEVTAEVSTQAWEWTTESGSLLRGEAGDWRVWEDPGHSWSVKGNEFLAGYEHIEGNRWRRTGVVVARLAKPGETVQTMEGTVKTTAGDWIVQVPNGVSWVVPDDRFRERYELIR